MPPVKVGPVIDMAVPVALILLALSIRMPCSWPGWCPIAAIAACDRAADRYRRRSLPVMVPELLILPTKVVTLATDMPAPAAETVPELTDAAAGGGAAELRHIIDRDAGPAAAVIVAGIADAAEEGRDVVDIDANIARRNRAAVADAAGESRELTLAPAFAVPPTRMPILPAVIDPLVPLVMPPEKFEMVVLIAAPKAATAPPTKMPFCPRRDRAGIADAAGKVGNFHEPVGIASTKLPPPSLMPSIARRDRAGIGDAAGEGRDRDGHVVGTPIADHDAGPGARRDRAGIGDAAAETRYRHT